VFDREIAGENEGYFTGAWGVSNKYQQLAANMSVHYLPAPTPPVPVAFEDNYAVCAAEQTPIVIDNGT